MLMTNLKQCGTESEMDNANDVNDEIDSFELKAFSIDG